MPIDLQGSSVKLMCSDHKIAKLYCENNVIYSSGNMVTYHVDSGVSYQEEVDEGASCLSPKTFTPTKSGWTFVGWRTDSIANGSVLSNLTMGDTPLVLYAVFRKSVIVTYYNGSATASSTSGYRFYNNGNVVNPTFTLTQAVLSGWTARGWSTSTAGNGGITYNNATAFTRDSNVTLYGMYQQTITLTYYNGSTTAASTSGTRYYNSNGSVVNPTFTLTPASLSGWTFRGWATSSAAAAGIAYSSISGTAFAASTTVYACYYQSITLSYNGNGSTGGSTAAQTGTRYWNTGNVSNPSFTLSSNGFSRSGYTFSKWALGSTGGTQYAAGTSVTLSASTIFYALWLGTPHSFKISDAVWSISDKFGENNNFNVDTTNNRITASAKGVTYSGSYGYTSVSATIPTGGCTKVRLSVVGLGGSSSYWVYGHVNGSIVCEANSGNGFTASGDAGISGDSVTVTLRVVNSDKNYAATGALTEIYFYN